MTEPTGKQGTETNSPDEEKGPRDLARKLFRFQIPATIMISLITVLASSVGIVEKLYAERPLVAGFFRGKEPFWRWGIGFVVGFTMVVTGFQVVIAILRNRALRGHRDHIGDVRRSVQDAYRAALRESSLNPETASER